MCRIAAYTGPSRSLATLLREPPHSLYQQSFAPREMINGTVNVDGTGVAWWDETSGEEPLVYVTEKAPWSDPNLARLLPRLAGTMQLASVRSATDGIPVGAGNVHPFVHGPWAFVHNGFLGAFRTKTGRSLIEALPDHLYAEYDAVSDSLALFLTILRHLEGEAGGDPQAAIRLGLGDAAANCLEHGEPGVLNLFFGSGDELFAARHAVNAEPNTLYVLSNGERHPEATLIASEPLDDDEAWRPVPPNSLVRITRNEVQTSELDLPQ